MLIICIKSEECTFVLIYVCLRSIDRLLIIDSVFLCGVIATYAACNC